MRFNIGDKVHRVSHTQRGTYVYPVETVADVIHPVTGVAGLPLRGFVRTENSQGFWDEACFELTGEQDDNI